MPAVARITDKSTGHGCFAPTALITTPVAKTYFNGKLAGVVDSNCKFAAHSCGITTHNSDIRIPSSGASKTYIEGKKGGSATASERTSFSKQGSESKKEST